MPVAVRLAMNMAVKVMQRAAEAAIRRATKHPAVRGAHRNASGTAIPIGYESHRDGSNCGISHHCQKDAARAFHVRNSRSEGLRDGNPSPNDEASKSR